MNRNPIISYIRSGTEDARDAGETPQEWYAWWLDNLQVAVDDSEIRDDYDPEDIDVMLYDARRVLERYLSVFKDEAEDWG